ncbi:hypothetical protein, partial [Nocardioides sp. GCM10030258]
ACSAAPPSGCSWCTCCSSQSSVVGGRTCTPTLPRSPSSRSTPWW